MTRDFEMAGILAEKIEERGGRAYFVGGYVRDHILGKENKDIDIEVHGIEPSVLDEIIDSLGDRLEMGRSFGIRGIRGYSLDIAMPRTEKKSGLSHRDFDVSVDPYIGIEAAAARRDFTMNAMMQEVLTGKILDPFGGKEDLEKGIIRHVNDLSFGEDPLRVLRAAQFAARFGFSVAPETVDICRNMDLSQLSRERIMEELSKALLKAEKPSIFFETLREMDQLDTWFPEVQDLIGVRQNPYHHSEGDAWVHTMMVLDKGVMYRDRVDDSEGFMISCLTHDFGKAICTEEVDGKIISHGHETKGLPLVERFIRRLTDEKKMMDLVLNLTEYHMRPNILAFENASEKATSRMFDRAIDPEALMYLAMADGRGKIGQYEYISFDDYLTERLEKYKELMARPHVMGRDLIEMGLEPGPDFTEILEYAHKLRLAGVDKEEALRQTAGYARTIREK